ncbi:MAG: hypothetical protein RR505_12285 [Raoultibacter sp.]
MHILKKGGKEYGVLWNCWGDSGSSHSVLRGLIVSKSNVKRDMIILAVSLVLYGLNRFILKEIVRNPFLSYFIRCHLNDCLGGICFIAYVNIALAYSKYDRWRIDSYTAAIAVTLVCGIVWEYIFPLLYPHGVSDFWDIVAYVLGGCIYILLRKRGIHNESWF